jgi:hypothetical protein
LLVLWSSPAAPEVGSGCSGVNDCVMNVVVVQRTASVVELQAEVALYAAASAGAQYCPSSGAGVCCWCLPREVLTAAGGCSCVPTAGVRGVVPAHAHGVGMCINVCRIRLRLRRVWPRWWSSLSVACAECWPCLSHAAVACYGDAGLVSYAHASSGAGHCLLDWVTGLGVGGWSIHMVSMKCTC